jgi:hypothetical protein
MQFARSGEPMYTNVNLAAPVGALLLLGTAVLFLVIAMTLVYSSIKTLVTASLNKK